MISGVGLAMLLVIAVFMVGMIAASLLGVLPRISTDEHGIVIRFRSAELPKTPTTLRPKTGERWVLIYECATVLDAPELAMNAAYWVAWYGHELPGLDWLEHATPEERLETAVALTEQETDRARRDVLTRREAKIKERRDNEERRKAAQKAVERREHDPLAGIPPAIAEGARALLGPPLPDESLSEARGRNNWSVEYSIAPKPDIAEATEIPLIDEMNAAQEQLMWQLAQSLSVPEPVLRLGAAKDECVHVWNAGRCVKCQADLIPCLCELPPQVTRHAAEINVARAYRESCPKCSPEDWASGWAQRQGIPDL